MHAWIALGTLVGAVALFLSKRLPVEAVALAIPVVLAATGTLTPAERALSGFGNAAVIALGGVFILGAGLRESGVASLMARGFDRLTGPNVSWTVLVIMVPAAVFSAFVANAATVAVFLPAVAALARRKGIAPSLLMMPLVHAALLGGVVTVIGTTPNLLAAEELARRTGRGLAMVDFAKVGLPVAAICTLWVALRGWRRLPKRGPSGRPEGPRPEEVGASYGFPEHLYRLRVIPGSSVVGKTIEAAGIGGRHDLEVVQVLRPGGFGPRYLAPDPDLVLTPGDELLVEGDADNVWSCAETERLWLGYAEEEAMEKMLERGTTLAEITLQPHAPAFGKTLRELRFRSVHGLNVVSLWRRGETLRRELADRKIELGDAFLVSGPPARIRTLARDPDFIVLGDTGMAQDLRRAPLAAAIAAASLLPALLGWLPLAVSVLGGALLMVGTRCISLTGAQRAVDFRVLFLIIGTLPLGAALEQQGIADHVAGAVLRIGDLLGPPGVLAALFLLAAVLSTTVNSGAAVILLCPVAAVAAAASGLPEVRFFLAVAFGASCVFLWPYGNQAGLLVMGPGGYTQRDFLRAGLGLTLLYAASSVALISLL